MEEKFTYLLVWAEALISLWVRNGFAEDARVLPQGRSRFSLAYAQTSEVSQQFNDQGQEETITKPYNLELNADLISKVSPGVQILAAYMNTLGLSYHPELKNDVNHGVEFDRSGIPIGDAFSVGDLGVSAQATRQEYVLSYQYGLTDRLSVGIVVPYIKTKVSTSKSLSNSTADIVHYFMGQNSIATHNNALMQGMAQAAGVNMSTLQQQLQSSGYHEFGNYQGSGMGDISLGGRYMYLNEPTRHGDWIASFQGNVTAPTGSLKSPAEITAVSFGQGAWDVGAAHVVNYTPTRLITLSQGLHYTYMLPDHREAWVKTSSEPFPTSEDMETVTEKLGNQVAATLGNQFNLSDTVKINLEYQWWWKNANQYTGPLDRDYASYSSDSWSYLETLQIGGSVSTIPAFIKYNFPVPVDANVAIYIPVRGRNAIVTPYGTAELALYF